ncbi:uncharacterized protein LOC133418962 [Cololabis saira]|uniref:uncharacterized protein LOC133418962 n=1 Tax=Cololabis saira TaxID=129043 RepID=UPI002AD397E1|nr:uncharacterized protein LOC133418962 [Cololabis saira]XP_061563905.1 uncharacterized protein LOC133418962 [Cololabis saira]XP_061563906.1 uncharacterized protein LOC133418962 [Cololabis saira]
MSCVEKRHVNHRMGSMLHHRFPNGFNDMFMDETDREVSTLTDRAFRSLCVGDDAVYNDEFLYGFSPFSCHKPLVGETPKKTHHKEFKKERQHKHTKSDGKPWKQQQQKNISEMSSFLKALSVTEESCELIRNGGASDSNGESWDKSALRSIQRELSEFSSDYNTGLTERHYKNHLHHQSGDASSNKTRKDVGLPSGKSTKIKNGKSMVKLKKLNIKNFFLHSEFSPFQTWTDLKGYPFGQEEAVTTILSTDNTPRWYDLSFYKELAEAHRKETQLTEETRTGQKEAVEPSSPTVHKPVPPPPPPKIMPKPSVTPAEKRCSSSGGDGAAAPWRRNSSRARSALSVNQPGIPHQESNAKAADESLLLVKEVKSVEVKAVEEASSVASTPFSICQLMTPLIPSRQPTETSEILQTVLSPSALELPGRPLSEATLMPEVQVKRESYKSLASSILFNLKDNRKRVKSRYSPPKFKTLELHEGDDRSSQSDHLKQAGSEGSGSGLSTPVISKDGLPVCSPILEPGEPSNVDLAQQDNDRPLSDDYLLSNLLHDKREENPLSPFKHSKMNKSPMVKKQNYPSLNLYKKSITVDSDMKYLQVPLSTNTDPPAETKERDFSPGAQPKNTLKVIKDNSSLLSPHTLEKDRLSSNGKIPPNVSEKTKWVAKDAGDTGVLPTSKEKETGGQTMSTMEVIRAAKEAINIAKNKARSGSHSDSISKRTSDTEQLRPKEMNDNVSKDMFRGRRENMFPESDNILSQNRNEVTGATPVGKNSNVDKEPPPVPKKRLAKSDVQLSQDKLSVDNADKSSNSDSMYIKSDLPQKEKESVQNQSKHKHIFSARQNNYIKHQRYAVKADEQAEEYEEGNLNVNTRMQTDDVSQREMRDSEHIIHDLQALKELERARLGDHVHVNAKSKLETINIEEEAKAKHDMISRELRNIKRGMLSMRGNTSAKREMFTKKEKEQHKQEALAKLDRNAIVNKARVNENYDKAKMALEEIITERKRRRNESTGLRDENPASEENINDEYSETWLQQGHNASRGGIREVIEKQNGSTPALKHRELKERLGDLRDHNQLRQILSQTEPRPGDTHRSGGRIALPDVDRATNELNTPLKAEAKHVRGHSEDTHDSDVSLKGIARKVSEESGEFLMDGCEDKTLDAPPVPPRGKKGVNKRVGSITKEKDAIEKTVLNKNGKFESYEGQLTEIGTGPGIQDIGSEEAVHSQRENSLSTCKPVLTSKIPASENALMSSPDLRAKEPQGHDLQFSMSPTTETSSAKAQDTWRVKRKASLKPDHLSIPDDNVSKSLKADEETVKISNEDANVDTEAVGEDYRDIVSPLLLVNSVNVTQSPPDQASLSSKSSYFSVESTLHRNTEAESNVYHSLENLSGEVEEVEARQTVSPKGSIRPEMEYNCLVDHEEELEDIKHPIKSPLKDLKVQHKDSTDSENIFRDIKVSHKDKDATMSPTNTLSPPLGIPALFKVKDNSFANKLKKVMPAWSPRGSLIGSERVGEEVTQDQANSELPIIKEASASDSTITVAENFKPKVIISSQSPLPMPSPSNIQSEIPKKPQIGGFLTVPQEEDRSSRASASSEGVESLATSQVETVEAAMTAGALVESERTKVPSERSGSTCSGNDSQTGPLKPPAILPKSDRAIQKAIKLTSRRIKKEEAQKLPQRSSQSSSKNKAERHKSDKSEQRSSSSARSGKSSDKKHSGKPQDHHQHSEPHDSTNVNAKIEPRLSCEESQYNRAEISHKSRRRRNDSVENNSQTRHARPSMASERQGRSSDRHTRQNPEQRQCSSDRVISNVPVYKAHVGERPTSDRPFNRSQSIDRYLGGNGQRRLSADVSVNEKLDPRTERIEKSIMDEFQQRGRARDKGNRDNPLRRSHSIDVYSTEVRNPPSLSRQSSHSSQFSRQSSIEHAIVTQSFPMTQRKLLQDPDSGRCFFVDLPVQVKTKTFFDPETGTYLQLPIQPPEGTFSQASTMEVLTPPLVVYHGFVPVSLSPMTQKTVMQAHHVEPEEFEQRHLDRTRQMHYKEGHTYLEPAYGQHDHALGDFMGTEELDCPS